MNVCQFIQTHKRESPKERVTGKCNLTKKPERPGGFFKSHSKLCPDLHPRPLSIPSLYPVSTETLGLRFSGAERKELDI